MTDVTWAGLGLATSLCASIERAGFTTPSPIQARAIAPQIEGRDLLGLAQTGSGKTGAFVLPILQMLLAFERRPAPKTARALILVPTRELAVQIEETARKLAGNQRLSTLLVLGGTSRAAQIRALSRGVDIVIATPGRVTDLMQAGHVRFDETQTLVLDEADRMLDMGFVKPVQAIAATLHRKRRTALFSATMPAEVEALAAGLMSDPVRVEVARSGETVQRIEQSVELIEHPAKRARLAEILSGREVERAIVFTRTKRGADRVAKNLGTDGIQAAAIHGDKTQAARQKALNAFRQGVIRVLVASDIASRGIDVAGISHVVQFEMPDEPEAYVHRIGRTGRNGETGIAIALCSPEERDKLRAVEKLTRQRLAPPRDADEKPMPNRRRTRRKAASGAPKTEARPQKAKPGQKQGQRPATRKAAEGATTKTAGQGGEVAPVSLDAERKRRRRRPRRRAA